MLVIVCEVVKGLCSVFPASAVSASMSVRDVKQGTKYRDVSMQPDLSKEITQPADMTIYSD